MIYLFIFQTVSETDTIFVQKIGIFEIDIKLFKNIRKPGAYKYTDEI